MIKITVDAQVYEALQKAFPKPANTAHRALAKYISVLEAMLFKSLHFQATPMQRKLDLFAISLQQLANQGGQIGPQKQRVHAWLRDNSLNLIEPVILGSNLTGDVSQCRLTTLVTMVDTLAVEDAILRSGKTEKEIDQYLCESPRVLRRLQTLRRWSHEQEIESFFTRNARTRCAHGAGASWRVPLFVGCN